MAFVVVARWVAKPGEEDAVARSVAALIAPSRAEPGNLFYQPHRDPDDPRVFYFYEQYADQDAYAAHAESVHFQSLGFGDAIPRLESRRRDFYETMDG
jgi:quinol monooxygenase YgiN